MIPKQVIYEITRACNLNCSHCGSSAGMPRQNELNFNEALNLINELRELGTTRLFLSGGEPTLSPYWIELAQNIDLELGLITNGFYGNEVIKKIIEIHPIVVGVSVDGPRSIHDAIRREGGFNAAMNTMQELKKAGIQVCAITTVSKRNINYLSDLLAWVAYSEADSWQLQVASPMGRMNSQYVINNNEYKSLCNFITKVKPLYNINIQEADCTLLGLKSWDGCQAGINSLGIRSNGDIIGCLSIMNDNYIEGNIRTNPLSKIWNDPNSFSYNRNPQPLTGKCNNCNQAMTCRGGCKSMNISHGVLNQSPYCNLF